LDATTTRKRQKLRNKGKLKPRFSDYRNGRRMSRRASISESNKQISTIRRKNSNLDESSYSLNKNKDEHKLRKHTVNDLESTSEVDSDTSKSHSKIGEDNFSKSILHTSTKQADIVEEDDDEDVISRELSNKKIERQRSLRRSSLSKGKRRGSIRKVGSFSGKHAQKRSAQKAESNMSLFKLQRADSKNKPRSAVRNPRKIIYKINDLSQKKQLKQVTKKLFYQLHDKVFMSALGGTRLQKPDLPQTVYPISRLDSYEKSRSKSRARPKTAMHARTDLNKHRNRLPKPYTFL